MPSYYKTTVTLKYNKHLNNLGQIAFTRTEVVTATGNTITNAENAALLQATTLISGNPNEKVEFVLNTIKITSNRLF